jgi:hypothetical protein
LKTRTEFSGDDLTQSIRTSQLSHCLSSADLLLQIIVELKVVRVDSSWSSRVIGLDVNIATREGQQAPVREIHSIISRREQDFGDWDLVFENEIIVDHEQLLNDFLVEDTIGSFYDRGSVLEY